VDEADAGGQNMIRDYDAFEETLKKANSQLLVGIIVRCVKEINDLKERNEKLEKRIEALEGKR
jgi:hypothetical protein